MSLEIIQPLYIIINIKIKNEHTQVKSAYVHFLYCYRDATYITT